MFKISKDLINSFSKEINITAFDNAFSLISNYIDESMQAIQGHNASVQSYEILVANEIYSGCEFSASNIDIFLLLDAKQIEINFNEKKSYKFKTLLSEFIAKFKKNFKLIKRKKISKKKLEKSEKKVISNEKYDVVSFYKDLQIQLCKVLYQTSKVGISSYSINVFGNDEFCTPINIYPVFECEQDVYKLYNIKSKKNVIIDFKDRFDNIYNINEKTDYKYRVQVRIFNNLFYNVFNTVPNQIFIESILAEVPVDFYTSNVYETTINVINYLKNAEIQNFKSICNNNVNLYKEKLNTISLETAYRFIKNLTVE